MCAHDGACARIVEPRIHSPRLFLGRGFRLALRALLLAALSACFPLLALAGVFSGSSAPGGINDMLHQDERSRVVGLEPSLACAVVYV